MMRAASVYRRWILVICCLLFCPHWYLHAQSPPEKLLLNERVLVVYNARSKPSTRVAEYYLRKRQIPDTNKCALKIAADASGESLSIIDWEDFDDQIKKPIRRCLDKLGRSNILYIVFTYETPFKLSNVPAGYGRALDHHISDIWDQLGKTGRPINPYLATAPRQINTPSHFISLANYRDQPASKLLYSVWRLDASSGPAAQALVDRAMQAEAQGLSGAGCFDRRDGADMAKIKDEGYGSGEWTIHRAAQLSRAAGFQVVEDSTPAEFGTAPAPLRCDHAALYAGWYSLNNYNDAFDWVPGAIGLHLDSDSAISPREGKNWSANAVQHGITITAGALAEPYLEGLPHPDGVFGDLFQGANAGDALLRNVIWLKWMIINIGDPLYRPFPNGRLGSAHH